MLRGRAGDWNSKSPQLQVSLFDLFGGGVSDVKPVPQLLGSQVTEAVVEDDRICGAEREKMGEMLGNAGVLPSAPSMGAGGRGGGICDSRVHSSLQTISPSCLKR